MTLAQIFKIVDPIGKKLERWTDASVNFVPNILIAVLVLIVFRFLASYISGLVSRLLGKASDNVAMVGLISALTRIAVVAAGFFISLGVLGLDKTVTSLLAGAGVLALAVGFAFQDLTTNFISGAFIAIQKPIAVGDTIETNGFSGKVKSIGLRSVKIDNQAGQIVELPSKDIFQKPILNFTHTGERRVTVDCCVSYHDDLEKVLGLTMDTVKALDFLSKTRSVEMNYTKFAESGVEFQIHFWIDQDKIGPGGAKSKAMIAIKNTFDANGVTIPFANKGQDVTVHMAQA